MMATMRAAIACLGAATIAVCASALAQSKPPPAAADIAAGRTLSERDCVGCHLQRFGSPEAIYMRSERKVTSLDALRAQVARCNTELSTQYFPVEEEQITAYLNATYYRLP